MIEYQNYWQQSASQSHLNLYRDWDYNASMADNLRAQLFEHGTIPEWAFAFCGGKPELANPNSWAFTWQSIFVYLLPGYWPFFFLWIAMTATGGAALFAWLRRYTPSVSARATAAVLYGCNGYFASHFNQGHVGFAFFHWVPILLWATDRYLDALETELPEKQPGRLSLLGLTALNFLFFTSAIPHAVFHFFPVYLLFLGGRFVRDWRNSGARGALQKFRGVFLAFGFGAWIAMYKLWPVIAWQFDSPRTVEGVEGASLIQAWLQTLRFFGDYVDLKVRTGDPGQVWSAWEYNAFVGPLPWLAFGIFTVWHFRTSRAQKAPSTRPAVAFAFVTVVAGIWLAMGNEEAYTPGFFFKYFPFLHSLRVFPRFQILTVFGLSVITAFFLQTVVDRFRRPGLAGVLGIFIASGGVIQSSALVYSLQAVSDDVLALRYATRQNPGMLKGIVPDFENSGTGNFQQSFFVRMGYWVPLCYEPLRLPSLQFERGASWRSREIRALTEPAPLQARLVSGNAMELVYAPDVAEISAFPFNILDGFELRGVESDPNRRTLALADAEGGLKKVTVVAHLPANGQGLTFSILGLLVTMATFFPFSRGDRRRRKGKGDDRDRNGGGGDGVRARSTHATQKPLRRYASFSILLAGAVLLVFGQVVFFDFVNLEDPIHIQQNASVAFPSWVGLFKIWQESYRLLYIPLTYTAWFVQSYLAQSWGLFADPGAQISVKPFLFHLSSFLVHVLNCFLVQAILKRLVSGSHSAWPVFFGTIWFAIHPAQVEAVSWISAFKDVFSTHWALWCILFFLRSLFPSATSRRSQLEFFASSLCFGLALLAKPSMVGLPMVLVVLHWVLADARTATARWGHFVPLFLFSAAFSLMTIEIQGPETLTFLPPPWVSRVWVALDALGFYAVRLVLPGPALVDFGRTPHWVLSANGVRPFVVALGVVASILIAMPRLSRRREVQAPIFFALVALLPMLGLFPFAQQGVSTVADRYLYFPMVAMAWLVSSLTNIWFENKAPTRQALGLCSGAVLVLAVMSVFQARNWKNSEALFVNVLRFHEKSWLAHNQLGAYHEHAGNLRLALFHYEQAGRLDRKSVYFNNAGSIAMQLRDFPTAAQFFARAIEIQPDNAMDHHNLALVLLEMGQMDAAKQHLQRAIRLEPSLREPAAALEAIEKAQSKPKSRGKHASK